MLGRDVSLIENEYSNLQLFQYCFGQHFFYGVENNVHVITYCSLTHNNGRRIPYNILLLEYIVCFFMHK